MNGTHDAPLALRPLWLAIGWAGIALDLWLSLTSTPPPPGVLYGFDAAHASAYATLMFWFAQLYSGRARLVAALGLVALGVILEILQGFNPVREMSFTDMRDNAIGVALGWLLAVTPLGRLVSALDGRLARRLVH